MTRQILAIFFHPSPSVTAVGGAEKRFIEILRVWSTKAPVTIVEPQPSLIKRHDIDVHRLVISNPLDLGKSKWLNIYLEWILWSFKACLYSPLLLSRRCYYKVVLASNNTLPNLVTAYVYHLVLSRPICVVVHHIDVLSPNAQNLRETYRTYREARYSRSVACVKTLSFQAMLLLLKRVNACITVSVSTANSLMRQGIPKAKLYLSSNGVDLKYINRFQSEKREFCDGVFVGRLAKEKGVLDMVQVWQKIVAVRRNSRLVIIGSGPDRKELETAIKENGLQNNIIVEGSLSDEKMYKTMKACSVFVFPSRFEGWGLAVAEALASGLPVVCYDIPALKEVFGRCKSVFFVPAGDIDRFAETVLRVMGMDGTTLAMLSRQYVKAFEWSTVASEDFKVVDRLMDYSRVKC